MKQISDYLTLFFYRISILVASIILILITLINPEYLSNCSNYTDILDITSQMQEEMYIEDFIMQAKCANSTLWSSILNPAGE